MATVTLEGVVIGYGKDAPVIPDLSVTLADGRFSAMVGPSGSGKTTILKAIGGFLRPRRGRILFDGRDFSTVRPEERNLGIVFQDYALFPHMDVLANVGFGLRMRRVPRARARDRVEQALELVSLTGFGNRYPDELSGGQQQRVALARALVTEPTALLLDEPLSALDRKIRLEMQLELRRIQRATGLTTIIVTHDQQEALSLGDELLVLEGGRIVQSGRPSDVYGRPGSEFVASFLGNVNMLTATVVDAAAGRVRVHEALLHGLDLPQGLTAGATVRVGVRPERLRVETIPAADPASPPAVGDRPGVVATGTLETLLLSGQTADCRFATDLGPLLVSVLSPDAGHIHTTGRYLLHTPPEDVYVFPAAG